jgi:hypothetical protein
MITEKSTEFDYLLKLNQARTPGAITVEGSAIKLGSYYADFKRQSDAQYLARAATTVPRLIKQLVLARAAIVKYLGDLDVLRKENTRLREALAKADLKLAEHGRQGQAKLPTDYDYSVVRAEMTGPNEWVDLQTRARYRRVEAYRDLYEAGDD